ncbi:DUF2849 domain-containing protein [Hansschlegelia plantiphila]|uniref:DUF2849 domain-containing protein n=1 Tax=Hansschlegelia plantiphila TaxID=374655 RepID=A0A9W6J316_9HYPH|nr:DUF2849 domain-containing protein [Hansschlegelia plantiphila]GLK68464.1 hypothetical protein GCM10008179_21020 [Hansschlegelia plantiphila]
MSAPIQKSAARTKAAIQVVTANRLDDGVVVYLDPAGGWTERLGAAAPLEGPEALEAGLAAGKKAETDRAVVESYAIDVARDGGGLRALRLRERIRAEGPTIHPELWRPTGA